MAVGDKAPLIGCGCSVHTLPARHAGLLPEVFEDTSLGFIHDGLLKGKVSPQLTGHSSRLAARSSPAAWFLFLHCTALRLSNTI
jgi:hypothetical protein